MYIWDLYLILLLCTLIQASGYELDDNNYIDFSSDHSLQLTQSLNLARQEQIQEVCRRFHLKVSLDELPSNQFEHILFNENHKLLYCYVPKVACTNWKRVLMILGGKWNNTDVLSIPASLAHSPGMLQNLSSVTDQKRHNMLETYHKMIIVRNPFERLLSAFRNKLEGEMQSAKYFQNRVGRRIIKAFRPNASTDSLEHGHDVTFKEFAMFLTSKPSVLADLAELANNEHWQPISNLCHPCLIKYTLVGKYETLVDDSLLALHTINASHIQFPRLTRTSGTAEKLYSYYSQLELPLIRKLYKLYKQDYKLFGYVLDNIVGFDLG